MLLLSTRLVAHLSRAVSEVSSVHLVGKHEGERLIVTLDLVFFVGMLLLKPSIGVEVV
jgi:hypothetical protein